MPRWLAARALGIVVLVTVPLVFGCYLLTALSGEQTAPAVALVQKLVLLAVLAWLWTPGGSRALSR